MKPVRVYLIIVLSLIIMAPIYGQAKKKSTVRVVVPEAADSVEVPEPPIVIKLSPDEESALLRDLNQNLKKDLEVIKKLDLDKYRELLGGMRFRMRDLPLFSRRDKEARERRNRIEELEVQSEALGLEYQKGNQSDKQKNMEDLKQSLSELFELREKERRLEYEELQKRLNELKTTLDQRSKNKEEIIRRRIMELTGESEYLRW